MAKAKDKSKDKKPAKAAKPAAGGEKKSKGKKGDGGGKKLAGAIPLAAEGETRVSPSYEPRLKTMYREKIAPALQKEFDIKNKMQIPQIKKIVINCGVKDAVANPKVLDNTLNEITSIAGQKAVLTRARKSIATFKVREGMPLGVRVTLRRARMYEFLDRLINVTIPRVRDFRGINPKSFDGRGNYNFGMKEQIVFPEINYDHVDKVRGMTITVETSAKDNEQARALLREFGMPFKK